MFRSHVVAQSTPITRNDRRRRALVRWLRRTADHTFDPDPVRRRTEVLLHERVVPVRGELLELAATLESTQHPAPACVAALYELLSNGCDSPLYNEEIHVSELRATLHYVRAWLASRSGLGPESPSGHATAYGASTARPDRGWPRPVRPSRL
jgi:hypothetical protein